MTALLLTVAALLLAPGLDAALRRRERVRAFGDGLVQVAVAGLLLVHVVPAALAEAGWPALFALAAGIGAGLVAHRVPNGERSIVGLALAGLVLHGGADGIALATAHHAGGTMAAAVVLHTLPVSLAIWRLALLRGGPRAGIAALAVTVAATLVGFAAAGPLVRALPTGALGVAECAVAGALLHVVGHLGPARTPISGWGGLAGVGVVVAVGLTHGHDPHRAEILSPTTHLAATAAPALLLGYAAALAAGRGRQPFARVLLELPVAVALLGPVFAASRAAAGLASAASERFLQDGVQTSQEFPPQPPLDRTAAPLLLGLGLAGALATLFGPGLAAVPPPLAVLAAAALGLVLPPWGPALPLVAAAIPAAGGPPGAALALLVAAPLLPGRRPVPAVAAAGAAVLGGLAIDALGVGAPAAPLAFADRPHGPVEILALGVLGLLIAAALVRRGPVGLLDASFPLHPPRSSGAHPHGAHDHPIGRRSSAHQPNDALA